MWLGDYIGLDIAPSHERPPLPPLAGLYSFSHFLRNRFDSIRRFPFSIQDQHLYFSIFPLPSNLHIFRSSSAFQLNVWCYNSDMHLFSLPPSLSHPSLEKSISFLSNLEHP